MMIDSHAGSKLTESSLGKMQVSAVASSRHGFMELSQDPESVELPEEGERQAQNPPCPATKDSSIYGAFEILGRFDI